MWDLGEKGLSGVGVDGGNLRRRVGQGSSGVKVRCDEGSNGSGQQARVPIASGRPRRLCPRGSATPPGHRGGGRYGRSTSGVGEAQLRSHGQSGSTLGTSTV
jgi:hypothetical protein